MEEEKPKKKRVNPSRVTPVETHLNRIAPDAVPRVKGGGVPRSPRLSSLKIVKSPQSKGGGAKPNAGRPRGGQNLLTVKALMAQLEEKSGGKPYAEILVDDFLGARDRQDHPLVFKYHQIILQKVMNTLVKAEVTDNTGEIEAKKAAFTDALANLVAQHSQKMVDDEDNET